MKICPQCGKDYDDSAEVCRSDRVPLVTVDPTTDPMLGKLLDGRYRLIRKIGEGGMGSIYRAVHTGIVRTCAIKLLTALSPGKEDAIARFKREANLASRIDNVHAVTIYDFGQSDDGMLFLAMEFIDGKPLSRVISENRSMPVDRVVHITNQIAEALAAAHALPIIHRDLKPDNIMITRKGADSDFVKVLDFGIAKAVADDGSGDNLTKTGFVLGTPVYMSPEQLLGEHLDPRSDIYSLAIIVYEMLTGRLPFEGDNPQAIMMKRVMSDPVRLRAAAPSLSESLEQAVMSGLERNRDRRSPTVEAFAGELNDVLRSSTQIMGGVVTSNLGQSGESRPTLQWSGSNTSVEGGHAVTGRSDAARPTVARSDANTWAPTEMGPAATRPPETAPMPANPAVQTNQPLQTNPMTPPSVQVPERPPAPMLDQVVITPERRGSGAKWLILGVFVILAVIGVIVYLVLPGPAATGFTLIVKGAPSGSQVFVNDKRRDATVADGNLKIAGIDPGAVNLRVSHEGFADFMATLNGAKGETQTCEAQLLPELDYGGAMLPVPAGEFEMGDNTHESDERPLHKVNVPSFYIDKYEVTNAQYKKFCDATRREYPANPPFDPAYFTAKPDYPVLGVTFDDALAFASWAGKRLATEEEWEKAASWDPVAHRKRIYPWGDEFTSDRANIATDQPVASAEPTRDISFYGVFHMAGNALEWVDAPYKPYDGNNKTPDPDYNKNELVIRGGTFRRASTSKEARTSYRNHLPRVFPKGLSVPVGIRCVVSADDPRIQSLLKARSK